ncbi:MAG TPA: calcium/sodium antiporter [Verrucomicrobiales bacterium]|jgi:cation:H+ antiporter|nr:calcium/sodium antiporter [Verrucomicrobiales bacterium]
MFHSILFLLGGVALAWYGGTLFVVGSVGLAKLARWPVSVIGVTVAAFGTSAPELMVAIHAAIDGVPEISLGDVLGSNVVNVAFILGVVIAASGLKADDHGLRRDWAASLAVPAVMAAVLWDGWFSRIDAVILMGLFFVWLTAVVKHARRHAANHPEPQIPVEEAARFTKKKTVGRVAVGLALLVVAAQLVVHGGKGVAEFLGWSPFVVGAIVVSMATSTPELATTIISKIRGHDDVGLGNILGSCVFNALFIAACAALIHPYGVNIAELMPSLIFGAVTVLFILPGRNGLIGRSRGFLLLAIYAAFLIWSLQSGGGH